MTLTGLGRSWGKGRAVSVRGPNLGWAGKLGLKCRELLEHAGLGKGQ